MAIYNFRNERIGDDQLDEVNEALEKASIGIMIGYFYSDIVEAYAELGETITLQEAEFWCGQFRLEVQQAMREAGREKILALATVNKIVTRSDEGAA